MLRSFEGFKFRKKNTIFHRADPIVKIIIITYMLTLSLIFFEPVALSFLFVLSFILVYISKSVKEWKESMKSMILFSVFIFILNYFFTTEQYRLSYSLVMTLRFLDIVSFFSIFFLTTSPDEFADSLAKLKIPYEYVLMFTMALRFVPTLARDLQIIYDAQRSRGLELEKGNFLKRIKNFLPILITLFIFEIRRSLMIAEALESRAFNTDIKRTFFKEPKLGKLDYMLLTIFTVFTVIILMLKYFNLIPKILVNI